MHGQTGHLVNGSGPYCIHDWREAEVELDITRRRRASLPEQRKKKVGKERGSARNGGGLARARGWLGSGHADEHGLVCVDKVWVPPACE